MQPLEPKASDIYLPNPYTLQILIEAERQKFAELRSTLFIPQWSRLYYYKSLPFELAYVTEFTPYFNIEDKITASPKVIVSGGIPYSLSRIRASYYGKSLKMASIFNKTLDEKLKISYSTLTQSPSNTLEEMVKDATSHAYTMIDNLISCFDIIDDIHTNLITKSHDIEADLRELDIIKREVL